MLGSRGWAHCSRGVGEDVRQQEVAEEKVAQVVRPHGKLETLHMRNEYVNGLHI